MKQHRTLQIMLLLLTVVVLGVTLVSAQGTTPTPLPALPTSDASTSSTVGGVLQASQSAADASERSVEFAQLAIDNADRALNTVNSMLGFLQVLGLAITVILGAVAYIGWRSIGDAQGEIEALKSSDETRMRNLEEGITSRVSAFERDLRDQLSLARADLNQLRDSLRADTQALIQVYRDQARSLEDRTRSLDDDVSERLASVQAIEAQLKQKFEDLQRRAEDQINATALVQLGRQQIEEQSWAAAFETFRIAHKYDRNNRVANYYLGELYLRDRKLDDAVHHLELAQPDGHVFPPAETALGLALRLKGQAESVPPIERNHLYAQAEQHFLRAVAADPEARDINQQSIQAALGALYRRQDRLMEAIHRYEEAKKLTPDETYPRINLAMLYLRTGDREQAWVEFRAVVEASEERLKVRPDDEWARCDAITSYLGLEQNEPADRHLKVLLAGDPSKGPIDSFLDGLRFMAQASDPPVGVVTVIRHVEAFAAEKWQT